MVHRLKGARGFLAGTGAVSAAAALLGVGLAAFATGGGPRDAARAETALGSNPDAIVADVYASAPPSGYAAAPASCQDCGPGLHERRALAKNAAWEAESARYEAELDRLAYAPGSEPAVYFTDEGAPPQPEAAFKPLGELGVIGEEGAPLPAE